MIVTDTSTSDQKVVDRW